MLEKIATAVILFLLVGCHGEPVAIPRDIPGRSTVGNGTDYFPQDSGGAWFLGNEKIRYCTVYAPDFGLPLSEVETILAEGFKHWHDYILKKKLNEPRFHPTRRSREDDPPLLMLAEPMPGCDGTEDLRFYLGVRDERVSAALGKYQRPIAIAEREAYDAHRGRGKGFVWIAASGTYLGGVPSWNAWTRNLDAIVLHELGHIAGCGHVGDTVMAENLIQRAQEKEASVFGPLGKEKGWLNPFPSIELWGPYHSGTARELLYCEDCGFSRPVGRLIDASSWPLLTGRPVPAGAYLGVSLAPKSHFSKELGLALSVHDEKTNEMIAHAGFRIENLRRAASFRDPAPVFKQVFYRAGASEPTTLVSHSEGAVYTGTIRSSTGAPVMALLKRNTSTETFGIDLVGPDGSLNRVFELLTVLEIDGNKTH